MGIIYLISVLILLVSFILKKKTDKEMHIISFICLSIVALFCYNTFVCYILTFFTIPITLWLLAIINIVISLPLIISIIRKREIQKFIFKKSDLIYVLIMAVVVLVLGYINWGFPFHVKYETSDPSVHYLTSVRFAENEAMMPGIEEQDFIYGSLDTRKPVSYVNSGLLMKVLSPDTDFVECYYIFVAFGMVTLFLTGVTFFAALRKFAKNKGHVLLTFIVSLICMLGYPLNSLLFGFEYLSMGLLIICAIIDLIEYYEKETLKSFYFILLMALLNFGLFCSYYMFVPFVYPALWIYFCIKNYRSTKKIVTKNLVATLSITLLVPFFLGYIYHLAPEIYAIFINKAIDSETIMNYSSHIVNTGLSVPGYIYINMLSNMILFIPLTIYLIVKDTKENKLKNTLFESLLLLFLVGFLELLLLGFCFGKVSLYYLSKNYFPLWIILLYFNFKALVQLSKNHKILPGILAGGYVVLAIIYTIFSNVPIIYVDSLEEKDEKIYSVMEIFGANKTILSDKSILFTTEELEILRYAKENLSKDDYMELVTNNLSYFWGYCMLNYENMGVQKDLRNRGQNGLEYKFFYMLAELKEGKLEGADYALFFYKEYNDDRLFLNGEIIFENSAGGVIKYNN